MTISGWLDPSKDTFVKELHQQHNFLSKKKKILKVSVAAPFWLLTYALPEIKLKLVTFERL